MIVADTSAWIEYLRRSGHPIGLALRALIDRRAHLAVTEVVVAELLAGARSKNEIRELRSRLYSFPLLRLDGLLDYEHAALVYRACRSAGDKLASITDCLIAVPAIRAKASLLHNDRDFDTIARHTPLKIFRAA